MTRRLTIHRLGARDRQGGIRPMSEAEFSVLAQRHPYYRKRWQYFSVAGAAAADLIARHGLRTALELGPHLRPLIVGADVMKLSTSEAVETRGQEFIHDAREAPWPFADGAYDLFVALQVFEHLTGSQVQAFTEVARVARHAIISLPIDWVMDDPANCHHGITHETALSWFAPHEPTRVVEGNPGPRRRMVYIFEDLRP